MPEISYGAQLAPARTPEVSNEMEQLASQCEVLDKGIAELELRLMTVIAQRSEDAVASNKTPEPVRVPLAQSLHDRALHLTLINDRVRSIMNRLEV